jgi:hypothetical protein
MVELKQLVRTVGIHCRWICIRVGTPGTAAVCPTRSPDIAIGIRPPAGIPSPVNVRGGQCGTDGGIAACDETVHSPAVDLILGLDKTYVPNRWCNPGSAVLAGFGGCRDISVDREGRLPNALLTPCIGSLQATGSGGDLRFDHSAGSETQCRPADLDGVLRIGIGEAVYLFSAAV